MKYLPTIDLWGDGVQDAITAGRLKLQPGQWVYCGRKDHKSRFVSINSGSFNVVHWQGSGKLTNQLFKRRIEVAK